MKSKCLLPSATLDPAFLPFPEDEGYRERGTDAVLPTPLPRPAAGLGHPQKYTFMDFTEKSVSVGTSSSESCK